MKKKVLIFGGTGMLGHVLFSQYSERDDLDVYATVRSTEGVEKWFISNYKKKLQIGVDANNFDTVSSVFASIKPDILINCIGITDKLQIANNLLPLINVNACFPHRLALLCKTFGVRLIHISTDGVFNGKKSMYTENDEVSINDTYDMSKFLGEVSCPPCLTLRTSIIGHELVGKTSLVEWFLSRNEKVRGYTRAIYSGLPTIELAEIISDYILPNDNIYGVYHVSSEPISKYDLLCLIADRYGRRIKIEAFDEVIIDRSLDSSVFRALTGYIPPSWPELVNKMYLGYTKYKGCMYV